MEFSLFLFLSFSFLLPFLLPSFWEYVYCLSPSKSTCNVTSTDTSTTSQSLAERGRAGWREWTLHLICSIALRPTYGAVLDRRDSLILKSCSPAILGYYEFLKVGRASSQSTSPFCLIEQHVYQNSENIEDQIRSGHSRYDSIRFDSIRFR